MDDEQLANAIIAEAGGAVMLGGNIDMFVRMGEWAQVGIEGLYLALAGHLNVSKDLAREALRRWSNDMGPKLSEDFAVLA